MIKLLISVKQSGSKNRRLALEVAVEIIEYYFQE